MGNAQGLKIKDFSKNEILPSIKISNKNLSILPYIHFITKLNRFQVANFPKNHLIKEFTIKNIITEKENVIHIDRMESGYFLNGLEYSFESFPEKAEFILITNLLENSISKNFFGEKIKENYTILLGDEQKYFESLDEIGDNINKRSFKFVFFNFFENKTFVLDYSKAFTDLDFNNCGKNDKVTLGIECGLISRLRLLKLLDKKQIENKVNKDEIIDRNLNDFNSNKDIRKKVEQEKNEENIKNKENEQIYIDNKSEIEKEITMLYKCKIVFS